MSDRSTRPKADILNATEVQINPATEDTQILIKAQTDKLFFDNIHSGLIGIDIDHDECHDGKAFTYSGEFVVNNDANLDILLVNPTGNNAHLRNFHAVVTSAPGEIHLYEGTTVSANGTTVTAYNRKRTGSAPNLALYHTPTITTVGTQLEDDYMSGGKHTGGSVAKFNLEWILKQNEKYLIRYKNRSGIVSDLSIFIYWYEV